MAVPQPQPPTGPLAGLSQTLLPSVLRTFVPICYALLVRWGLLEWLGLPDEVITYIVTGVVTTLFYVVLRVLERYWDKIGWLLGYAARPAAYVTGKVISVEQNTSMSGVTTTTMVTPASTPDPKTEQGAINWLVVIAVAVVGIALILLFNITVDIGGNG
jgi:hypothetical protein